MIAQPRIQLLQAMPFFGAISEQSIQLILQQSETMQLTAGEYFFRQGDNADSLYILEQGEAAIFKHAEQHEFLLRHANCGDCFGELALIDLEPRSASVRAITDCTAINISSAALHNLYQANAEQFLIIQMNIARELSRRLRSADERWFQLAIAGEAPH